MVSWLGRFAPEKKKAVWREPFFCCFNKRHWWAQRNLAGRVSESVQHGDDHQGIEWYHLPGDDYPSQPVKEEPRTPDLLVRRLISARPIYDIIHVVSRSSCGDSLSKLEYPVGRCA